ncbi:MAG TPA: type II secretion system F family protein, partial [bacterium]|nr:type II secretion system F family protein [bacterium]
TLEITEAHKGLTIFASLKDLMGIPMKEKVIFTRQLAAIVNAGIPLLQALQLVEEQTSHQKLREIISKVLADIEGGKTFSEALALHPEVFSNLFVNIVKAGEVSGTLDTSLTRLADQMERDNEIRGKIKGAMILPGLVMVAMVGVIILMSVVVIPELSDLFAEAGENLPIPTQIMLWLSDFLINLWWLAIMIAGGSIFAFFKFIKTPTGKNMMDVVTLKLPVFGNMSKLVIYTRMTRVMAMLMSSGVPLLKSLEIVADLVGNHIYTDSIKGIAKQVEKGVPLATGFKESGLFPEMIPSMVGIGEQTGAVDDMLFKLGQFYDTEVENITKNLTTLLEPLLMAVMGAGVGFIVMAILMPIYNLVNVIE